MPGHELIGEAELLEVADIFNNGGVLFRHGFDEKRKGTYKVQEFEELFAAKFGVKSALAVSSGTAGLRVALAAFGLKNGDEVITQSFTFVATVEAIVESGATPVCVNIDDTLNMDVTDLVSAITSKTKAVVVVHMLGVPCDLRAIKKVCQDFNLFLIEDTAWGCGGFLDKISLGTWGDAGVFSFDYAKTITTGEGGMIIFKDQFRYDLAAAWHDHGHENNPAVPRWEDTRSSSGFNFRMTELQGAVGKVQLGRLDFVVENQRVNRDKMLTVLQDFPDISPRKMPPGSYDTADALIFFVESKNLALACRKALLSNGLSTKILPEAYGWHFAGSWDHIPEITTNRKCGLHESLEVSAQKLSKAVSLPMTISLKEGHLDRLHASLSSVF